MPAIIKSVRKGRWWFRIVNQNPFGLGFFFTIMASCPSFFLHLGTWTFSLDRLLSESVEVEWGLEKEFVIDHK